MEKLYIVIPAYNEEENIEHVVREWYAIVEQLGKQSKLCIIDDGPKDGTYAKLQELERQGLPQLVAMTKPNSGHGSTVLYGYHYALEQGADYVFQTDSDGQTLASDFPQFWENRKNFDLLIGARKGRQDGVSRIFVTNVLRLVLFVQFRIWIQDANTPFRLMSSDSLQELIQEIPANHNLSNVLLSVLYHQKKKQICYFPITFRPRQGGVNSINFKRIIKIGIKALKDFKHFGKGWTN